MNVTINAEDIEHIHDALRGNVRPEKSDAFTDGRLRSIVGRIERLSEERTALSSDIKDIFTEAKSAGFDVKVLRRLISDRKKDAGEVREAETMLDLYRRELGM